MTTTEDVIRVLFEQGRIYVEGVGDDDGPRVPLPPPGAPSTATDELIKAYYQGVLAAVAVQVKDQVAAEVDARKLEESRQDKALEVQVKREDTATALAEARVDTDRAAEAELLKSVHDAYITVAQGALDRATKRAEFITTVVSAVSGTYTVLLGLVYGLAQDKPLAPRALWPVAFFGIALVLAATYMAYLKKSGVERELLPVGDGGRIRQMRLQTFFEWTFSGVLARGWALRLSVFCLGAGIALLPLPFITIPQDWVVGSVVAAIVVVVFASLLELVRSRSGAPVNNPEVPDPLFTRYF